MDCSDGTRVPSIGYEQELSTLLAQVRYGDNLFLSDQNFFNPVLQFNQARAVSSCPSPATVVPLTIKPHVMARPRPFVHPVRSIF